MPIFQSAAVISGQTLGAARATPVMTPVTRSLGEGPARRGGVCRGATRRDLVNRNGGNLAGHKSNRLCRSGVGAGHHRTAADLHWYNA